MDMGYWLAKKLVESHAATQGQTPEEQIPACLASFLVVDLLWNPTWACQSTNSRVVKKISILPPQKLFYLLYQLILQ